MSCAFHDCGDPACRVCWWGRQPQPLERSAVTREAMREDAQAELKGKRGPAPMHVVGGRAVVPPKRKHRVGPHR